MPSFVSQAIDRRIVQLVNTNEVKFLAFPPNRNATTAATVGVRGLGACSVVIVASSKGAIVGHIGPNIQGAHPQDVTSWERLAHGKMAEMAGLLQQHAAAFPADSPSYIICATFQRQPLSPEQLAIFRQWISRFRLPVAIEHFYEQAPQENIRLDRPEGTVWVDGRGPSPRIYLEDRDITAKPPGPASTSRDNEASSSSQDPGIHAAQREEGRTSSSAPGSAPGTVRSRVGWVLHNNLYTMVTVVQGEQGRAIRTQSQPPIGVPVYMNGSYWSYDGARWKSGQSGNESAREGNEDDSEETDEDADEDDDEDDNE